jgi:exodeoxyribonuclease VII large subunit
MQRVRRLAQQRLQQSQQRLDYATRMLSRPSAPIAGLRARVEQLRLRLRASLATSLSRSEAAAAASRLRLERHRPDVGAATAATRALNGRLRAALMAAQDGRRARLDRAMQALVHLDPAAVLGRGYALALDAEGHVVTDAARLRSGDRLDLRLAHGRAAVRVEDARQDPASREAPGGEPRSR